jgi:hypothetical protein
MKYIYKIKMELQKRTIEDEYAESKHDSSIYEKLKHLPIQPNILFPSTLPLKFPLRNVFVSLFQYLKKNRKTLSSENLMLKDEETQSRVLALINDNTYLDLSEQYIENYIDEILFVLKTNPQIKQFILTNNFFNRESMKKIIEYIEKTNNIEVWNLSGNNIDSELLDQILYLAKEKNIKELFLKRNPILNSFPFQNLNYLTNLTHLDVGFSGVKTDEIFIYLNGNINLRYLDLSANGISKIDNCINYFDDLNKKEKIGIVSLNLGCNRIGDDIQFLIDVLLEYKHLKGLDVSSNRIEKDGLKSIIKLKDNTYLEYLNIGYFKNSDKLSELSNYFKGCGEMIETFLLDTNIFIFDISFCHLTDEEIGSIKEVFSSVQKNIFDFTYFQNKKEECQEIKRKCKINYLFNFNSEDENEMNSNIRKIKMCKL